MSLSTNDLSLEALLLDSFTNEELEQFLCFGSGGRALRTHLPDRRETPATYVYRTVEVLDRRGLLTADFFDRLAAERPARSEEIARLRAARLAPSPTAPQGPAPQRAQSRRTFIAFAREDEEHVRALEKSLTPLRRQGLIDVTSAHDVLPGEDLSGSTETRVEAADLILLIVSADFLASTYCWDIVVPRAMALHDAGQARVIPIHVRPCDLTDAPFRRLRGVPEPDRPITGWPARDAAWTAVAQAIRETVALVDVKQRPA